MKQYAYTAPILENAARRHRAAADTAADVVTYLHEASSASEECLVGVSGHVSVSLLSVATLGCVVASLQRALSSSLARPTTFRAAQQVDGQPHCFADQIGQRRDGRASGAT